MSAYAGLGLHLGNLSRLSDAKSRSISAENVTGAKGVGGMAIPDSETSAARELGQGWKVAPCSSIAAGDERTIVQIDGPGAVQ